jgi:hypothetical protein
MKSFLILWSVALLVLPLQSFSAADCLTPADIIGASYTISENGDEKKLTVLRQTPARVVYLMESEFMTRIYEHYGENRVGVTEYFDLEEKGVEHEPSFDIAPAGWEVIYELFPAGRFESMRQLGNMKFQCLKVAMADFTTEESTTEVQYLVELKLPLVVKTESGGKVAHWRLDKLITDDDILEDSLERVSAYATFDFADLGDHEDQEFFRAGEYLKYKQNLKPVETSGGHSH